VVHRTIDKHGDGQVETCRADGLGAVKDEREAWTEGPAGRLIMVVDTWGHQQARVHVEELTVMTNSRQWLTKSSKGAREHGDQVVEDDGDTCRDRGGGIADTLL
jgi:hypothetical protein